MRLIQFENMKKFFIVAWDRFLAIMITKEIEKIRKKSDAPSLLILMAIYSFD
jgi:hypothetical protein